MRFSLYADKPDLERANLAKVWEGLRGVVRIGKFWIKPKIKNKRVSIDGYDSFCLVPTQILEIGMLMAKDEMIARLNFFLKKGGTSGSWVN
jgi:hypothetical protein